ncbi:MAG: hypothetical protein IJ381_02510 [Clostridia bacterium]|nr:hypothetical protein [Clostridia bacterium]
MKKLKTGLLVVLLLLFFVSCAAADGTVTGAYSSVNADGSVTVSWSYSGSSDPVAYVVSGIEDPSMQSISFAFPSGSSATLYGILCGYDYTVELLDSSFYVLKSMKVSVPHEDFTDLKTLKFQNLGVVKMDAGESKFRNKNIVKTPNAESIGKAIANGQDYRFYVKMYTPSITKGERSYLFMLAVTAPNGYTDTMSGNFVLENVGKRTDWTIWPLSLESFYKQDALTSGQYTVRLYLDGGLVGKKTIQFK